MAELESQIEQLQREIDHLRADNAHLRGQNEQLHGENARLRQELRQALEKVAELQGVAARQAAPFRRREQDKVPPGERKRPGRKLGHPGAFRRLPEYVDEEIKVPLDCCPKCQGPVTDRRFLRQYIEELPPIEPYVVRLVTYRGNCQQCGEVRSTHPLQTSIAQGAAQVQLGPRALAVAAMLNKHLGLTMGNTSRVFKRLFGLSITRGGLAQALARTADKVRGCYEQLVGEIRRSPATFADETSWWVGGPHWWLWGFTTPETTVYRVEPKRDSQVVKDTLGEDYAGMLVSDCLNSYDSMDCRKHKCIAHHLRAIAEARDSPGTKASQYFQDWQTFFQTVIAIYNARENFPAEDFAEKRANLEKWCDALLDRPCQQPAEEKVRNRLEKQRAHLLGCLYEPHAEPTNNRAERALRPAVIARKLSCGNKTRRGSRTFETLASLAATCHQRATDFVDYLTPRMAIGAPAG